ncbi:MAG: hypothetical protein KGR42_03695 [Acidobacteria bacterium]|nr:hypothetical protein [Acidobacteriota bacterium]
MVGQSRSTQRLAVVVHEIDEQLRAFLREFATKHPRWSWRRANDALRDEGWRVNHK